MPKGREGLSEVWNWEVFPIMSGLVDGRRCSQSPQWPSASQEDE